ncbi:MAG: MFS transporter [Syntrophales bacterium]
MARPGIFWGWFVVAGAFFVLGINYGARYCFGVFIIPMSQEYGWSRSVISLAASLNMFVYAVCAIFVGRLLDKMAPRWIISIGAVVAAASFILTGFVKTPLQFYIVYGLLCGMGSAGLSVVVGNSSVGKWFIRKRGTAMGISTMGISFGTIMLTPLSGYIAKHFGWHAGFIFLGVAILFIGVSVSQFLMGRASPEACGLLPDGEEVPEMVLRIDEESAGIPKKISALPFLKDSRFWILGIGFGLAIMTMMSVFMHVVAYAMDKGLDKITAASALSAIGIAGLAGQFFYGWLSDRLRDVKHAAVLGIFVMASGTLLLLYIDSAKGLYFSAIVYGFGYGSLAPMMPIMAADRFGRDVLGSVYGMLTFFIGTGGSIGPILGGVMFDALGSYRSVWQFNIAVLAVVITMLLMLKPGHGAKIRR